jgi:hypothetical protein
MQTRNQHLPRASQLFACAALALALIGGFLVADRTPRVDAAQASWVRTQGSTCATPPSGSIGFNRFLGSSPFNCKVNRATNADSFLRTSGSDVYLDGFFVGSNQNSTPNTDTVKNNWTVTANLCVGSDYFVTRNTLLSGGFTQINNGSTTGLLSYRSSSCINN